MTSKMQTAVNHALKLQANATASSIALARARLLAPGMSLDQKRTQSWCEFGWPADVTNEMLYRLYRRGGVAHGAVEKIIGACWMTWPEVIEGGAEDAAAKTSAWEDATAKVLDPALWRQWSEADRRRLVSRYSGLILHVADNKTWDQPVVRSAALRQVTPVWAGALEPIDIVTDTSSPDYAKPRRWKYTEQPTGGTAGRVVEIHPDRIFILGDWHSDAIGFLEPAFNAFVSLEKVEGGSGESFLKNASRQISVNFDKDVDLASIAATYGVPLDELQQKFNDAAREINRGNDQMLITQGAEVSPLVAPVADPEPTYGVNLQTVAAALDIPTKVLVGMQTGERASTEDQRYFYARCQSRRQDLSFDIGEFVDHLMRIKVLETRPDVSVLWDDLNAQTADQRLAGAKLMSDINQAAFDPANEPFTKAEIRVAAGYEPEPTEDD